MSDNKQATLFPLPEGAEAVRQTDEAAAPVAAPRLKKPVRDQIETRFESLDQRLDADHLARDIWTFVQQLDMSALLQGRKAVEGRPGRDATDPRVLLALWLFAIAQGVGSARALDDLCRQHRAYEWLRGGVGVNYHLLSDFRVEHWDFLNQLFVDSLASFMREGLLELGRTAQDGMRVRAHAGKASFRRQATLEKCLAEAQEHVAALNQDFENGSALSKAEKSARQRAARERHERVHGALEQVQELARLREARERGTGQDARASTTDPEARNMKFPDGGFRPGYNVQFSTDASSGLIAGADVTNQGTDAGLMEEMVEQIKDNTGKLPDHHLTDGGYSTIADIEKVEALGVTVFTPVKEEDKKRAAGIDPFQPRPKDSAAIAAWRQRMGTPEAQEIYKLRAQTAEWTNAQARNRNLYQVPVRGLAKVKVLVLWYVLVHNFLVARRLRRERAEAEQSSQPN